MQNVLRLIWERSVRKFKVSKRRVNKMLIKLLYIFIKLIYNKLSLYKQFLNLKL